MSNNKIKLEEDSLEFKIIKAKWEEQARNMTLKGLHKFVKSLNDDYIHDYGTICHAMAIAAIAAAWAMDKEDQGGITGFQAGGVMWEFIRNWNMSGNKTGMKIIDYDDFLYPQYQGKHQMRLAPYIWEHLQKEAKNKINSCDKKNVDPDVYLHWEAIVNGHIPFGYRIESKNEA